MSRPNNPTIIDRLRLAISTLLGRPAKPAPAYATVRVRRYPHRFTQLDR
jgi:hypothetical protein